MRVEQNNNIKFGSYFQLAEKLSPEQGVKLFRELPFKISNTSEENFTNTNDVRHGIRYLVSICDHMDVAIKKALEKLQIGYAKKPAIDYFTEVEYEKPEKAAVLLAERQAYILKHRKK